MDRGNAKHGPFRDDAMAHDVQGYVRAGRDTRAEEWKSPEPPAEDLPELPGAGARRPVTTPGSGMSPLDVEERSELARWLGRAVFPAGRDEVIDYLHAKYAPERVVAEVMAASPDARFGSSGELWRALRGSDHVESRWY
jgi:hypothetical protein